MRISIVSVSILVCVALVAAPTWADAPAQDQTLVHAIRGQDHRFTVPAGWSTYPTDDGVAFAPPPNTLKAPFNCTIIGAAMPQGVDSTASLVKMLADDEMQNRRKYLKVVSTQKWTSFIGAEGDMLALRGTDPDKKTDDVLIYISARPKDTVYIFVASGLWDDFSKISADMDKILAGVTPLGTSTAPAPAQTPSGQPTAPPTGSFGDSTPAPQTGPPRGIEPIVNDPLWGLAIDGLDAAWRLKLEGSSYVLMYPDPPASITIQRLAFDNPAKLTRSKELKDAKKGRFGANDALIVDGRRDGAPEKSFYVIGADHAIVVRFASPTFESALKRHLPDLERAIHLGPSTLQQGKKGGVSLALPFNVALGPLPPPWRVDPTRSGAGSVWLIEPEAGVQTELRVRLPEGEGDNPFYGEEQTFATTCTTRKGTYDELPVAVVGAAEARRYRCRNAHYPNGDPMAALMYRAAVMVDGKPVHIMTLSFFQSATGETPDRPIADFMQYVRMGK